MRAAREWLTEWEAGVPRLAVVGSRGFADHGKLAGVLAALLKLKGRFVVISGGAMGAASLAIRWAREQDLPTTEYLPNYAKYGKAAPLIRNQALINAAQELLAFWDGQSSGTAHTIRLAQEKGIPVTIIRFG